jgi:hypothetical protein
MKITKVGTNKYRVDADMSTEARIADMELKQALLIKAVDTTKLTTKELADLKTVAEVKP